MRDLLKFAFCLAATGLAAQSPRPAGQHWIQGQVADVVPDSCHCIKDLVEVGVGGGTWFTSRWGAGLDLMEGRLDSRHTSAQAHEQLLNGSLLFGLNPGGIQWFPYLSAGLGAGRVETPYSLGPGTTTRLTCHEGAGIQGFFDRHLVVSLEARAVSLENRVARTEKQIVLGMGYRWGGAN
jgi:hypothetical protein